MQESRQFKNKANGELLKLFLLRFFRWIGRGLALILLFFILSYFTLQIPTIQNWAASRVTKILKETLGVEVSIDYLNLAFLDRLDLEGVFIEDLNCDSLLFSQHLYADINANPFVLLTQGLVINEIRLEGAKFYLKRDIGSLETNLDLLFSSLFPRDSTKAPEEEGNLRLNIRNVYLKDVLFIKDDQVRGQRLYVHLPKGTVLLDQFDLEKKIIQAKTVRLSDPTIQIDEYQDFPLNILPEADSLQQLDSLITLNDSIKFVLEIEQFKLNGGRFNFHNTRRSPKKTTPDDQLDYNHMQVYDINFLITNFFMSDYVFQGNVLEFSFKETSGFQLENAVVKEAYVSPKKMVLNGLHMVTPFTTLGDTLIFNYDTFNDYKTFTDNVEIDGRIKDSWVAIKDIMVFAPALKESRFFSSNRDEVLTLGGKVKGEVNNLRGRDLRISLGKDTYFRGRFSSRGLAERNEEFLNLRVDELISNMRTMRSILPNFNPPSNFDKLGRLYFSGRFDGFFEDFVANGELQSDLGKAEMDMRMNLTGGKRNARYSGTLQLTDFNLRQWTDNEDLGLVSFRSEVAEGIGLTSDVASATLDAQVTYFSYRGYDYENAFIKGQLNKNFFDGRFNIQDNNIDFNFLGELDFRDSIPVFDFDATINKLDLKRLNLWDKDVVVAGKFDLNLKNETLSDMQGEAKVDELYFLYNKEQKIEIDSILVNSNFDTLGNKVFTVRSDVLDADIIGQFDIEEIPVALVQNFVRNYPKLSRRIGLKPRDKALEPSQFAYTVQLKDSKELNRLLDDRLEPLIAVDLNGYYHSQNDSFQIAIETPKLHYDKLEFFGPNFSLKSVGDEGTFGFGVDSTIINKNQVLEGILSLNELYADTLKFSVGYESSGSELLPDLLVEGFLFPIDSLETGIHLTPAIVLSNKFWAVKENNQIVIGPQFIQVNDFSLVDGDKSRKITLDGVDDKGIKLSMYDFGFDLIHDYWDYEPLQFDGRFNSFLEVKNVFKLTDIRLHAISEQLQINDDDWGRFWLELNAKDLKNTLDASMSIIKADTSQILLAGSVNLPGIKGGQSKKSPINRKAGYFDFRLDLFAMPLKAVEYFIGNNISNTYGDINGQLRFYGLSDRPNIEGNASILNGGTTIDYLNTHYRFDQSLVTVNNFLFDFTNTILKDKFDNEAVVFGGISHSRLKDFKLAAQLTTKNRFLALDTNKGDNDLYYGQALGQGMVDFSGSFSKPNISINAAVGKDSWLAIPVTSERDASELTYIRWKEPLSNQNGKKDKKKEAVDISGLQLTMDLQISDEAEVEIIFDEQAGDAIKGSGRGNLSIIVPRKGDLQMYGNFVVEEGSYLFTFYNFVNKNFNVKRGGTVSWSGNPFAAEINIEAEYRDLNTSVANFIGEYLQTATEDTRDEASKSTDVILNMNLTGELLQPVITFDIEFPALSGELKSYTDSKLRTLRQDQNAFNQQVFGLIVAGQFIPGRFQLQSGAIIYNTVSEFVSNQLSLLITELFSEFIEEGQVLSGIDFDIAYSQYQTVDFQSNAGQPLARGEEFEVRLKQDFFNDRLSVQVGSNIEFGANFGETPETSGTFVGNDVVIEYVLNTDRSLKLRVYQRSQPAAGGGRRLQVGTGVSFKKEFNSFHDFIQDIKTSFKKIF